jgi:hypothetical protein
VEKDRDSWKQAAFIAHQSGSMARAKKVPPLKEMISQFDPKPDNSAELLRMYLEALGGVTHGR